MVKYYIATLVLCFYICCVKGQYEDVRCKCVCPSITTTNGTEKTRRIYVHSFREPERCKCQNVVDKSVQEQVLNFCDRCECKWQRRNTTTIKVVVIIIICLISGLFLYMLFLLCLDPLMSRRPKSYLEHQNEEDTQSVHVSEDGGARQRPTGSIIGRVQSQISRISEGQLKWKGTVQEQRRNIYDRQTMLN